MNKEFEGIFGLFLFFVLEFCSLLLCCLILINDLFKESLFV